MAARRRLPFTDRDKGFRDAVIFWSIVDHALSAGRGTCELVSGDAALAGEDLHRQAMTAGVHVTVYKTVNELADAHQASLDAAERKKAGDEQEKARAALEAGRAEIQKAVVPRAMQMPWDIEAAGGRLRGVEHAELGAIGHVRTPFPAQPGPVQISFDAEVRIYATIERYPTTPPVPPSPFRAFSDRDSSALQDIFIAAVLERKVFTKHVAVEATAVRTADGKYEDIKVSAVRGTFSLSLAGLEDLPI
jgi:hypothetical protein